MIDWDNEYLTTQEVLSKAGQPRILGTSFVLILKKAIHFQNLISIYLESLEKDVLSSNALMPKQY